jgi:16S rRNA (uracil1498-N3)-methyltransferase
MSDRSSPPLDRFYVPGQWPSDVVAVTGSEAHHLLHVLRKSRGDRIEIFDGRGRSAEAEIIDVGRREVEVRILSQSADTKVERAGQVWIAAAPPKGERLKGMIEKLTEVGADRIVLLETERSVVHPGETKFDKLQQVAIAACKQCRRNTLPEIVPALSIDTAIGQFAHAELWVADRNGKAATSASPSDRSRPACCFVGPEGGLTAGELQRLMAAGANPVSLGPHVLRVETAAVLAAGWLMGRNRAE